MGELIVSRSELSLESCPTSSFGSTSARRSHRLTRTSFDRSPHSLPPFHLAMTYQPSAPQTAAALFSQHHSAPTFSSGSSHLDELLTRSSAPESSTGLRAGSTVELYGPSGVGKTRTLLGFSMQARFRVLDAGEDEEIGWDDGQVLVAGQSSGRPTGSGTREPEADAFTPLQTVKGA